jgi:YD repeat-containing protein
MVAIVAGNALGLSLGSSATLGEQGTKGMASTGRSGERLYVNAATGNLVLQAQDEWLAGRGLSAEALRTYNSQGKLDDDNGDNWSLGVYAQQMRLSGGPFGGEGTLMTRTGRDGAVARYGFDAASRRYITTAGDGAHDSIRLGSENRWIWTDGSTGREEHHDADSGRLVQVTERNGAFLNYDYDAAGRLRKVSVNGREETRYIHERGLLTELRTVTLVGGQTRTSTRVSYAYDDERRLSRVTVELTPEDGSDASTYWTDYRYHGSSHRLRSLTQKDGTGLWFEYDREHRVKTVTDALDNVTTLHYLGSRTEVVQPSGIKTWFDRDEQGQLKAVSSVVGTRVVESRRFDYNKAGDVIQVTDGEGRSTHFSYDLNGNQTGQSDALGNKLSRRFDDRNQLLTETLTSTEGRTATTRQVYDAGGRNRLRFVISAEGRVTEHLYDAAGQRTATLVYTGARYDLARLDLTAVPTERQMQDWARLQRSKRNVVRTGMAYDARGQLERVTLFNSVNAVGEGVLDGHQSITRTIHDQWGRLRQTIAPSGSTSAFVYDSFGRMLSSTDARGVTTLTIHDDLRNETRMTFDNGLVTTSTFDRAGRLTSVLQADRAGLRLGETVYAHDKDGRLRMTQDATGRRQWLLYDAAGRQTAAVDADGSLVEHVYDRSGRLAKTIAYTQRVDTAALADHGTTVDTLRPARSPATDVVTWILYDAAGRPVKTVDAAGFVTETVYDAASRVAAVTRYATPVDVATLPDPSAPRVPKPVPLPAPEGRRPPPAVGGNPAASPTPDPALDRTTRFFYDADGRLTREVDGEGHITEHEYDAAGRRTVTTRHGDATAAEIRTVTLYNGQGRVAAEIDGENHLTEYLYDTSGRVKRQLRYHPPLVGRIEPTATLAGIRPRLSAGGELQVTAWEHDELDRVKQMTSPDGTVTTYEYDRMGRLAVTRRAIDTEEVRAIHARFDLQGRLVGELSAEGGALLTGELTQEQVDEVWRLHGLTHSYDAAGRRDVTIDRRIDGEERRTLHFYDADGRLERTVNPRGEVQEWRYNGLNQLELEERSGTATSDRASTVFTYNNRSLLETRTVALEPGKSAKTRFDYNGFGQEAMRTSDLGAGLQRIDRSQHDRRGLLTVQTLDEGGLSVQTVSQYDAFGRRHTFIDGNGHTHVQRFDRLGRVVQTIDALGQGRSTTYDAFDRVLTQTNALDQTTTYHYDTAQRSVTVTTPENISVRTVRNRHGEILTVTDGEGATTTFQYDLDGRLTDTWTPDAAVHTHQRFDRAGQLVTTVDAQGNEVKYEYLEGGRIMLRRVDPTGLDLQTRYEYDGLGRQFKVTDPDEVVTLTGFDLEGRVLTQTVDPGGLNITTIYTRDVAGNTLTVEGPGPRLTTYVYDALGRRTEEHVRADADKTLVTRYDHDANGNVTGRTDPEGHRTRFIHDAQNRLLFSVDALGNTTRQHYDEEGRLARITRYATPIDLTGLAERPTAEDVLRRAEAVARPDLDAVDARRYDKDGRLRCQVDGVGAVVEFVRDKNGNVVERRAYANAVTGWDGQADPVAVRDDARDQWVRTTYDKLQRATHVADATGAVTERRYDGNGNVLVSIAYAELIGAAQRPDEVRPTPEKDRVERSVYDAAGRLRWHVDGTGAVIRYDHDPAGQVERITRYARRLGPNEDPSSLGEPTGADRTHRQTHDAAGRRRFAVDAEGGVDEWVHADDGTLLSHTRFGHAVAAHQTPDEVRRDPLTDRTDTYQHDAAGRLKLHTDAAGNTETFDYDGLGNKTRHTDKRGYTWTWEYDAAGRLLRQLSPAVAISTTAGDDGGNLGPGSTETAPIVTFYGRDALGRVTSQTDAEGLPEQSTTRFEYDAAGRQVLVTYPEVGVYDVGADSFGTGPEVRRLEARAQPQTRTVYDPLGNAVARVDAAGHVTLSVHDQAGRVIGEIDALGHATAHERNAFGEAEATVRYATPLALTQATPQLQAQEARAALAALASQDFDPAMQRRLDMRYDALGRLIEVKEPLAYDHRPGAAPSYARKVTTNQYDAFGDLRLVTQGSDTDSGMAVSTHHYRDRLGRLTGMVDALGYVTVQDYDAAGNLLHRTEYSTALAAGTWNAEGFATPEEGEHDRVTSWSYDSLNRKTSETRHAVRFSTDASGVTEAGDVRTEYRYDAQGNLTHTIDALGAVTITDHDAMGRVWLIRSPERRLADGSLATPITYFLRDARGNAVVQVESALGGTNLGDRVTFFRYDALGREVQRTDAMGVNHFQSYDALGQLGKQWHNVTHADESQPSLTWFRAFAHDRLGRVQHIIDPASFTDDQRAAAGVVDTVHEYNAFGELTAKYVAGTPQDQREYFDYDSAGRLWRSNTGDGVDRIHLHDVLGRETALIVSTGEQNLRQLSLSDAAQATGVRLTETHYDALGRALTQTLPGRELVQGGVSVRRESLTQRIVRSEVHRSSDIPGTQEIWDGQNEVELGWTSLAGLGAGDIKVRLDYLSAPTLTGMTSSGGGDAEGSQPVYSVPEPRSLTRILSSDEAQAGARLVWESDSGIGVVQRVTLWKQDALGEWRLLNDQTTFGASGNTVAVDLPEDPQAQVRVQIREADGAWTEVVGVDFGSALWFDARGVGLGSFEYRVLTTFPGAQEQEVATGTLSMTTPVLSPLPAPAFVPMLDGFFGWTNQGAPVPPSTTGLPPGVKQVFNYRAVPSGTWTSLPIVDRSHGAHGVETSWMPGGTYEYELLWINEQDGVPTAHATGTFTVTPAVPGTPRLPAVNLLGIGLVEAAWQDPHGISYDSVECVVREKGTSTWTALVPERAPADTWKAAMPPLQLGASYEIRFVYRQAGTAVAQTAVEYTRLDGRFIDTDTPLIQDLALDAGGKLTWTSPSVGPVMWHQVETFRAGAAQGWVGVSGRDGPVSADLSRLLGQPGTYEIRITKGELNWVSGSSPSHATAITLGSGVVTVGAQGEAPVLSLTTPAKVSGFRLQEDGRMSWTTWGDESVTPVFEARYGIRTGDEPDDWKWFALPVTRGSDGRSSADFLAFVGPLGMSLPSVGPDFRVRYVNAQGLTVALGSTGFRHTNPHPSPQLTLMDEPGQPGSPRTYGSQSTTDQPTAISLSGSNLGYILHQEAGKNGLHALTRPTVVQTFDRWGNVLTTTDPRNPAWKTEFDWNHDNQIVYQRRPAADGGEVGGPVTQIYYDRLGRQVAVRDANGHVNGHGYDAAGQLVAEFHADEGQATHGYDVFGRRVQTTSAQGNFLANQRLNEATTETDPDRRADLLAQSSALRDEHTRRFNHDRLDRLTSVDHGRAFVYRAINDTHETESVSGGEPRDIVDHYTYDEAGRQLSHTNGNGELTLYRYDLAGRVVRREYRGTAVGSAGLVTAYAYDARGRKTLEVNANGDALRWTHDASGRVSEHTDLGGTRITFQYDRAGQLKRQQGSAGQDQSYTYDSAGQLTGIDQVVQRRWVTEGEVEREVRTLKRTRYAYDLAGNRVHERTEQDGVVAQDNYIRFDALSRMREVYDGRVHLQMDYDLNGNRTVVKSSVRVLAQAGDPSADQRVTTERHFGYDAMNRQTLVDGSAPGIRGAQGHTVGYDKNGNRISDTYLGRRVLADQRIQELFDDEGRQQFANIIEFAVVDGVEVAETYRYDALNRLQSVQRDGVQLDYRQYDGAGRVVRSGTPEGLPPGYTALVNEDRPLKDALGLDKRIHLYDAYGRLKYQNIFDGNQANQIKQGVEYLAHDAVGNVLEYRLHQVGDDGRTQVQHYRATLAKYEGYVQSELSVAGGGENGRTASGYDLDGHLAGIDDRVTPANNRRFITDAQGRVLLVRQGEDESGQGLGTHVRRQLIVGGEALGEFGVGPNEAQPLDPDRQPQFEPRADFSFGYQPISGNYPGAAPGAYTVRQGDSLQSIARSAYGDSRLWYRIAEANGLGSDDDLRVGQTLTIPAGVGTVHNDGDTFEPYDPSRVVGDTTPSLPFHRDEWRALSSIIAAVVTLVVSYFTGGNAAWGAMAGDAARQFSSAMLNGRFDWKDFAKRTAKGAALGPGVGDHYMFRDPRHPPGFTEVAYDYKATAIAGLAGWAGSTAGSAVAGQAGAAAAGSFSSQLAQRVVSNLVGQGLNRAVRRHQAFDWKSFVGAATGIPTSVADLVGMVAGYAMNGGVSGSQQQTQGEGPWSATDYVNGPDLQSDQAHEARQQADLNGTGGDFARMDRANGGQELLSPVFGGTFAEDSAMRRAFADPYGLAAGQRDAAGTARTAQTLWGVVGGGRSRTLTDTSSDSDIGASLMRQAGFADDYELIPISGGSVRVTPSGGGGPTMVNGISVNRRADAAFAAAGDLLGMGQMYRDYKLLGSLMAEAQQQAIIDRMKGALQERMGMMRNMPSEAALGASPIIDANGVVRYDPADLIDRYGDALRKVELWKRGTIELDTRSMLITSIGSERMSPMQWVDENTQRYQRAFAAGLEEGRARYARGTLPFKAEMPQQLQESIWAHQRAELAVKGYNLRLGVSEGPGQLVSLNRWAYDPGGSGMTVRPDMLLDLGPNRPGLVSRFVVDGKSSLPEVMASSAQLTRISYWLGGASIKAATPEGLLPWFPRKGR